MCHPGAWLEACTCPREEGSKLSSLSKKNGASLLIGVDSRRTEPLPRGVNTAPQCLFFTANIARHEERLRIHKKLSNTLQEHNVQASHILLSGTNRIKDPYAQCGALLNAVTVGAVLLRPGGAFVAMTRQSPYTASVIAAVSTLFRQCLIEKPTVIDPTSHALCLVCLERREDVKEIPNSLLSISPKQNDLLWYCLGCKKYRRGRCQECSKA